MSQREELRNLLPPLQPGNTLSNGRYTITEETVNQGGFGRIYCARSGSRPTIAIKEFFVSSEMRQIHSRIGDVTQMAVIESLDLLRAKFYAEVKNLRLLHRHCPNHIPQIHSGIFTDKGRDFYAMSFIRGRTLTEIVQQDGTLSEDEAIDYIVQIAKVLHSAHHIGMNHGDVSPNNIMVNRVMGKNNAVLVDFGNANSYNQELATRYMNDEQRQIFDEYQADINRIPNLQGIDFEQEFEDMQVGTPGFRPPFTFTDKKQADLYSLAATMFFVLTGSRIGRMNDDEKEELLTEHNVSTRTIYAIINATQLQPSHCTPSFKQFLNELPQEKVINSLLSYQ